MLCYGSLRVLLMTAIHTGAASGCSARSCTLWILPCSLPLTRTTTSLITSSRAGVHFIRRMKEELVDYDGVTPLFKGRRASNVAVPLNATEALRLTSKRSKFLAQTLTSRPTRPHWPERRWQAGGLLAAIRAGRDPPPSS